jgi:hypothetical protein
MKKEPEKDVQDVVNKLLDLQSKQNLLKEVQLPNFLHYFSS